MLGRDGFKEDSCSISDIIHNYFQALVNIQTVLNNSISFVVQ